MVRLNQLTLSLMLVICPLWGCDDGKSTNAAADSASTDSGSNDAGAMGDAGMMGELNAVPFGQRHWPWSDHRPAADADARATGIGAFVYET